MGNVMLGFVFCGLPFAGKARAADKQKEEIRAVILKAMENWSALNAEANAAYYTSSARAVFFDFTPMQYLGWETYKNEIKKVQESIKEFKITLNDDLTVHVAGQLAWATATWKMDFLYQDGKTRHLEGRLTEVLEEQKGKWKIVHEHASVPTPE